MTDGRKHIDSARGKYITHPVNTLHGRYDWHDAGPENIRKNV